MTPSFFGCPQAHFRALISAWILAWLPVAAGHAAAPELPLAADFAADAQAAAERRVPILVFYTRDGCSWCELARRSYLRPLADDPQGGDRVLIREVRVDMPRQRLAGFDGRRTTHAAFARERRVKLTPTLDFLDARGQRLVEPLVGVSLPDFYGVFIDRAIDESLAKLRAEPK